MVGNLHSEDGERLRKKRGEGERKRELDREGGQTAERSHCSFIKADKKPKNWRASVVKIVRVCVCDGSDKEIEFSSTI